MVVQKFREVFSSMGFNRKFSLWWFLRLFAWNRKGCCWFSGEFLRGSFSTGVFTSGFSPGGFLSMVFLDISFIGNYEVYLTVIWQHFSNLYSGVQHKPPMFVNFGNKCHTKAFNTNPFITHPFSITYFKFLYYEGYLQINKIFWFCHFATQIIFHPYVMMTFETCLY